LSDAQRHAASTKAGSGEGLGAMTGLDSLGDEAVRQAKNGG
jgi:hypothetical protein